MNLDFSQLNFQYLIQARDLARQDRQRASVLLGIPDEMVCLLPDLSPQLLAQILQIKSPLVIPRQEIWWWSRFLVALQDGRSAELATLMDQASLILGGVEDAGSQ